MNTVYLSQAEPLLRGAHAATINQKDRDELRAIHCHVLRFMRGAGIFIGEIPPDKTSAPKAGSPIMDEDDARAQEVKTLHVQRDSLIAALQDTLAPLQDAQNQLHHRAAAAAFINAREIIRHCLNPNAEKLSRGLS